MGGQNTSFWEEFDPNKSPCGRVVTQPERFIGLGEVPKDPETDPSNYNEAVQDKDATLWQGAMKTELESMYSNQVRLLADPPMG